MMATLIRVLATALAAATLTAQVTPVTVDGRRYLAEPAKNGQLHLHPDNCFFNGAGLHCTGKGTNTNDALNKGKSFTTIAGLTANNEVCWYVQLAAAGDYTIKLQAPGTTDMHLLFEQQRIAFDDRTATLHIDREGVHCLRVHHDSKQPADLEQLTLTGNGIETSSVLRTRWRPAAAHTRFSSSTCREGSLVWIMEMDAAPGRARFYSPMTTPFGYFGPSWTREGKPTGLNFSMWSYGRGQAEPPIAQLSHLLAVGNPEARFNGFGHEGTGVKPRGWNPFEEWQGDRCVLALRMEPGTPYDTYHGYIFDEKTHEWRLYAAGRKHAKKRRRRAKRQEDARVARSLWAGSFVEVPGPPQRQRTGHIVREMRYRGFVLDENRTPHALDRMAGAKKPPVGNQGRGLTEDGRFRMWIGGMEQFESSPGVTLDAKPDDEALEWLQPDKLAALFTWPTTITVHAITAAAGELQVQLTVQGLGKLAGATLHYGSSDALTLATRWDHASEHLNLVEGEQTIAIALPKDSDGTAAGVRFARMLVENDRGKFWSLKTATIGK